jgi:hypothetical protein
MRSNYLSFCYNHTNTIFKKLQTHIMWRKVIWNKVGLGQYDERGITSKISVPITIIHNTNTAIDILFCDIEAITT